MKKQKPLKDNEGYGCTTSGRCYRWEYDAGSGQLTFRGPGISKTHQPGRRHPARRLAEAWLELKKRRNGEQAE